MSAAVDLHPGVRRTSILARSMFLLALIAYAALLVSHLSYAAGGADTSGYLNLAKLLATGRTRRVIEPIRMFGLAPTTTLISVFTPIGFTWGIAGTGTMAPGYQPGLPLHLVAAASIGGWKRAPFFVSPIAAILCVAMMFQVGRKFDLSPLLSAAGAATLGVLPQLVWHALQPASDVVATLWSLVAIWCALKALENPSFAFAAGTAFAIGVWVRPTGILLAVPVVLAFRLRPGLLWRCAAGALPFAVALMLYQRNVYGSPFKTAYGTAGDVISTAHLFLSLHIFAGWLFLICGPLLFPIGLLVAFDRGVPVWHRVLLSAWFGVFLAFYCLWGPFDDLWSLRFLLPGTPALILGTLLLAQYHGHRRAPGGRQVAVRVGVAIGIAVLVGWPLYQLHRYNILDMASVESIYPEAVHWAERRLPANAIVISGSLSGAFFYYADRFSARADQLDNTTFQQLRPYAARRGLRWYAVLSDGEPQFQSLEKLLPGRWTLMGTYRNVAMWRLDS
jgi:hypothetical protein